MVKDCKATGLEYSVGGRLGISLNRDETSTRGIGDIIFSSAYEL